MSKIQKKTEKKDVFHAKLGRACGTSEPCVTSEWCVSQTRPGHGEVEQSDTIHPSAPWNHNQMQGQRQMMGNTPLPAVSPLHLTSVIGKELQSEATRWETAWEWYISLPVCTSYILSFTTWKCNIWHTKYVPIPVKSGIATYVICWGDRLSIYSSFGCIKV